MIVDLALALSSLSLLLWLVAGVAVARTLRQAAALKSSFASFAKRPAGAPFDAGLAAAGVVGRKLDDEGAPSPASDALG